MFQNFRNVPILRLDTIDNVKNVKKKPENLEERKIN